ncbi:MAG: DUF1295 domain-containing protein [Deltaproteobacteria bacterium]|nr:DUF1295 domain-containing protein [Deltaproteobacteria bacterium]
MSTLFAHSALALAIVLPLLWLTSLARKDASIADPFWGVGFLLVALVSVGAPPWTPRALLMLACVALWSLRLSWHLLRRNLGHGEDPRYQAMRKTWGRHFWWVSFFTVFVLQFVLLWIISLPLQIAALSLLPLGPLDLAGAALFAVGLTFETLADAQLTAFRRDPASQGQVLDTGVWRYTRHPNYFGEAVLWWGLALFGVSAGAPWTLVSALVITLLLLFVSGVPMLEKGMAGRRPGYAEYVRRTSAFVPWRRAA